MAQPPSKIVADPVRIFDSEVARERYFNRELSWLGFNRRVMEEARNPAHPLLEQLRFLSISGNNLDEFFMVRVAGLKGQMLQNIDQPSIDGRTPGQQLAEIEIAVAALMEEQQAEWTRIAVDLALAGLCVITDVAQAEPWIDQLEALFLEQIFPILTPQALDPSHPFPFIPNKGLSILFDLVRTKDSQIVRELVLLPHSLPRFIPVPRTASHAGEPIAFIAVETLIERFTHRLFPGYTMQACGSFRILRDSDIDLEEEAEDLVRFFRSALKRRRRGRVIRLELDTAMSAPIAKLLRDAISDESGLVDIAWGFLGIGDLSQIADVDRPDLKFTTYVPRYPERIREHGGDIFAAIRSKDLVVHHPYESFEVVLAFLRQAAADPDVVAIKQTLYRAGNQSPVIRALIDAAEAGKSVTAVVELKARFDEEQNLHWASQLERAGVQVVYGFIEWKTHAKVSMVVRREDSHFRTYCHFGTGNYHPVTARIYTDFSYFTADPAVGRDAAQLFNYVTGYVEPHDLECLVMSPHGLRERLSDLIDAEIDHARAGHPAAIWAKMNSLVDAQIIEKLYEASSAGVQIDLIIRGICCLRPGVPGMSDCIRVKSVIGRFLEHSRVWAFGNGSDLRDAKGNNGAKLYISSADWMPRNFDRRVEYMIRITNPTVHDQLLDQVIVANLLDNQQSWTLHPNGHYVRVADAQKPFNLHRYFMTNPSLSGRGKTLRKSGDVPTLDMGHTIDAEQA